jgi:hypothetical protein
MQRRAVLGRSIALLGAAAGFRGVKAKAADVSTQVTCGVAKGHPQQKYLKTAKRMPKLPDRSTISAEELPSYDQIAARIGPDGGGHFPAFCVAPRTGAAISGLGGLGDTLTDYENLPGHMRAIDHQYIDMVLPLDSGYYSLILDSHLPHALSSGIKMETIEALRDHRDDLVHPDDRQGIEFVRAVRDGKMTDEIWDRTKAKIGERGVVEFVHFVNLLIYHHKFAWAVGVKEMSLADFNKMIDEFKSGARKVPALKAVLRSGHFTPFYACAT